VSPVQESSESTTLFEDAAHDQRVRVYREDEQSRRMIFHGILPVDEAREENVAELFGGGKFRAQLMVRSEQGQEVINKTIDFRLPGAYKPPTGSLPGVGPKVEIGTLRPVQVAGSPEAGRGNGAAPNVNEILNQALVSQVLDVVKSTREGRAAAGGGIDWTPIITAGLGALTAFIERGSRPDHALQDQLRELRDQLNGLRTQPGPVSSSLKDVMEALKGLTEVRSAIAGGGESTVERDPMDKMIELGQTIISAMAAGKQSPVPQRALNPGEEPMRRRAPVPAPEPEPVAPARAMWQQMLHDNAPRLLDGARRGLDPEFMAEMAANFMPSEMIGVAVEFLNRPDHATIALQEIPALAEFPTFNEKFWAHFKATMMGEPEEEGDGHPA